MIRFLLPFCLLWTLSSVTAQDFDPTNKLKFVEDGKELRNPLTGGLNAPQFGNIDMNDDGHQDIIIFDRVGNVFIPLLNDGTDNKDGFDYAPSFIDNFPKLINWVVFRDYNQDGVQDLFAYSTEPGIAGIEVHTGKIENGEIAFDKVIFPNYDYDIISYPGSNGLPVNLYVSNIDYPEIKDIDCDGDMDVLTFNPGGGYVEFYKNLSEENGNGLNGLDFVLDDACYGGIYESGLSEVISLPCNPGDCGNCFTEGEVGVRHAGSSLLCLDSDADDDFELLLGDLSFTNITMLLNNGNCDESYLNEQIVFYPEQNPVDIPIFPAAFYFDADKDGVNDLVAAPNNINNSLDTENVWFYKNNGANDMVDFEFSSKNLFANEMLDMGTGSKPTFADVNGDGLLDLVVGTLTKFVPFGEKDGRLYLYINKGSATEPIFELTDTDWLDFKQYNSDAYTFAPTFGDLDGDGDLDLLVGEAFGSLFYAENIGGEGNPMDFEFIIPEYMNIDIGQVSVPIIYDLDKDGLNDLIVGERNGNLNFFKNVGTPSSAMFGEDVEEFPNTPFLGGVTTIQTGFVTGFTNPRIIQNDNEEFLVCGSQKGNLFKYEDLDNIYGSFSLVDENYGGIHYGEKSSLDFADLDNDGKLEMIGGNTRGGLSGYLTNIDGGPVSTSSPAPQDRVIAVPNPTSGHLQIVLKNAYEVSVFDILGKLLFTSNSNIIDLTSMADGIYIINVTSQEGSFSQKILKQ